MASGWQKPQLGPPARVVAALADGMKFLEEAGGRATQAAAKSARTTKEIFRFLRQLLTQKVTAAFRFRILIDQFNDLFLQFDQLPKRVRVAGVPRRERLPLRTTSRHPLNSSPFRFPF
jgi:hypothetical protein